MQDPSVLNFDDEFNFIGTGNPNWCDSMTRRVMNFSQCILNDDECDETNPLPPPPIGEYMASYLIFQMYCTLCNRHFPFITTQLPPLALIAPVLKLFNLT